MTELSDVFWVSLGYGVVAAVVLIALHLALWQQPWRLSRPAAYAVGVMTFVLAAIATAAHLDSLAPLLMLLGNVAPGCLAVVVCYWWRAVQEQAHTHAKRTAAQQARRAFSQLIFDEATNAETRRADATRN